jgi:hypothetical protein
MRGTIRRRLLVNALVDPYDAARHLPVGLRPHVIDGGTVVGCCLLDIDAVRPASLPAGVGTRLRDAAHRVSVEWEDEVGATTVSVYVPVQHTVSPRRKSPGRPLVPRASTAERRSSSPTMVGASAGRSSPAIEPLEYGISVSASITSTSSSTLCEPIGGTCLSATVGLSPDHHGALEAARMEPDHRRALQVEIGDLDSGFLAGFTTAQRAPSYLMREADVTWTKVRAPRLAPTEALT